MPLADRLPAPSNAGPREKHNRGSTVTYGLDDCPPPLRCHGVSIGSCQLCQVCQLKRATPAAIFRELPRKRVRPGAGTPRPDVYSVVHDVTTGPALKVVVALRRQTLYPAELRAQRVRDYTSYSATLASSMTGGVPESVPVPVPVRCHDCSTSRLTDWSERRA